MDTGWGPEPVESMLYQRLRHSGCPLVPSGDGLGVLREDVGENQNVLSPIAGWLEDREIDCKNFIRLSG